MPIKNDFIDKIAVQTYNHNEKMKKYSAIIFLIGLAILLITQQKVVMPLIYEVIKSDLFLVDSKDKASQMPISTHLTDIAFNHCKNHIPKKLPAGTTALFSDKPINSWSLGNYQYVINLEANVLTKENSGMQKFVCRISYTKGDDQSGINEFENWSIDGIAGLNSN